MLCAFPTFAVSFLRGATARGKVVFGIAQWLASVGMFEYAQRFAENRVDLSVLRDLTDQDLKDLGVCPVMYNRRMYRTAARLAPLGLALRRRAFTLHPGFPEDSARPGLSRGQTGRR